MAINRTHLIPLGTTLVGFVLGWAIKPSLPPNSSESSAKIGRNGRLDAESQGANERNREPRAPRPTGVRSAATVAAEITPDDLKTQARLSNAFQNAASQRDRAKLIRMSEALNLSEDQIARVDALIAEQRQNNTTPIGPGAGMSAAETLAKATEIAQALDAKFREILTPEQSAALDTLQTRQQENRAEARAQRELSDAIDRIDVNPAQREAMLEVLRTSVADDLSQLPASTNLLSESNLLGAGSTMFSDRTLETMSLMGDANIASDPMAVSRKMQEIQRARIAKRADALAEILTPGQLQQYRAATEGKASIAGAEPIRR